jgi:hypothetical protein
VICRGNRDFTDFIWSITNVVLHTPVWPVGISIEGLRLDAIYVFVDRNNTLTHIELLQQIARYRVPENAPNVPVYVGFQKLSTRDYYETDPQEMKESLSHAQKYYQDKANQDLLFHRYLRESVTFDHNDPLLDHLVTIVATRGHSYNKK